MILCPNQYFSRSCASTLIDCDSVRAHLTHASNQFSTCPAVTYAVLQQIDQHSESRRSSEQEHTALTAHVWRHHCQQASIELPDTGTSSASLRTWNPKTGGLVALAHIYSTPPLPHAPSWKQRFWEVFVQSLVDIVANTLFMGSDTNQGGHRTGHQFELASMLHRVYGAELCTWLTAPNNRFEMLTAYASQVRSIRIPAVVLRVPESVVRRLAACCPFR